MSAANALEVDADRFALDVAARRSSGSPARGPALRSPSRGSHALTGDRLPHHLSADLAAELRYGSRLPTGAAETYGARLDRDLSQVRVHEGAPAERLSARLGATAFTIGDHVFLGDSRTVDTADADGVLAHELAHVAQLAGQDGVLMRQTHAQARTVAAATPAQQRTYVQETIEYLEHASAFFAESTHTPNVTAVLAGWRRAVDGQSQIVLRDLNADPTLFRALRDAYRHALNTLVATVARLEHRDAAVVFEENRARIPDWAFPDKHVAGITTPVPQDAHVARGGTATTDVAGVHVVVRRDGRSTAALGTLTELHMQWGAIASRVVSGHVTSFHGPGRPLAEIQTLYAPRERARMQSGYGRGTTAEDVAAGDTTLGFHEGHHGQDFQQFFRANPAPVFGGQVGMTSAAFAAEGRKYQAAMRAYLAAAQAASVAGTDCVGTTIDQFHSGQGGRARIICR